jgi:hypothetical protein
VADIDEHRRILFFRGWKALVATEDTEFTEKYSTGSLLCGLCDLCGSLTVRKCRLKLLLDLVAERDELSVLRGLDRASEIQEDLEDGGVWS